MNNYRNRHYHTSNGLKIAFSNAIDKQGNRPKFNTPVEIMYIYYGPDKRKRDLGNSIQVVDKFFQDYLVSIGVIPEDTVEWVKRIVMEYGGIDKDNPRIECFISEYTKQPGLFPN